MKKYVFLVLLVLILPVAVFAHGEDGFEDTKQLIASGVSCDELSDEQLESIGDFFMEQMHPGEQHEIMDEAMGGEGSESLKQTHIRITYMMYCNNMRGGMMNMAFGMMGSGSGMMYGGSPTLMWLWSFLGVLFFLGLTLLVWVLVVKLWKDITRKKG